MKMRNIIIGALMTVIAAPAMAQQQDAIQEQVAAIIKSGAPDAAKQVAAIAKQNKKDVNALVSIGKAYLAVKDYANAKLYAQQAADLVSNKKAQPTATPFVLLGNIAVSEDDGGTAAQQFQQAMYFDPKNPDGYRRYAQIMSKTDPNGAVQTLEDLRAQRPDYPVDLIAAEIYSNAGKMSKAIEYYDKVQLSQMKDYQISDYATNLFLSKNYDKSLQVATEGHNMFPRNASFNRLMMFNYTDKKEYEKALEAADKLFNASDSLKTSVYDYTYHSKALKSAGKYQEAIAAYQNLQGQKDCDATTSMEADKSISDCYKSLSDYAKAGEYLDKYLKAQTQKSFSVDELLAQLYVDQLADDNSTKEDKQAAYDKADALYKALGEKYPDNAAYVAMKRARMPFSLAMPQMEQLKLAGPHFATLGDILYAKSDRSAGETKMLGDAYNTLIAYYVHAVNDMDKAKEIASKLIELDPENANAKAILGSK
jgi:tetratricopeptide (TPR) repeat protein